MYHFYRTNETPENDLGVRVWCPHDFVLPVVAAGEIWPIGWDSPDAWAKDSEGQYWLRGYKTSIGDIIECMKEARWTDAETDAWLLQVGEITQDMAAFNQESRDRKMFLDLKTKYNW